MDNMKLFLLDAYALIYRSYYALIRTPRMTSKGLNTSAIFGFCNTLDEVLRKENPDYIAVCFDPPGGHTFRNDLYPDYKAQREKQPEDITLSIPYIKEIIKAWRIPVIEVEGFEADDVIGTLATQASAHGFMTYMMTPDKDYGQLVTDTILQYRPSSKGSGAELRGPEQIKEIYGVQSTAQIIDLLALEGDASDNIPGCPGVGEKTAQKLIAEFGSVENLLDHTDALKGALQRKVTDNADKIRFSKLLATIRTDVPLDISFDEMRRREPDVDKLRSIYSELEFRSFIAKLNADSLLASGPDASDKKTAAPVAPSDGMGSLFDVVDTAEAKTVDVPDFEFQTASSPAEAARLLDEAIRHKTVGISLHAIGDEEMTAQWVGIAFAYAGKAVYVPIPEAESARQEMLVMIEPLFTSPDVTLVSHDLKRDIVILHRDNINLTARYFDTSVAHYLLKPEMRHNIETVAFDLLGYQTMCYAMTEPERRKEYSAVTLMSDRRVAETAYISLRLMPELNAALEQTGQTKLLHEIELPFIPVLAAMETEGVRVDVEELSKLSLSMTARLEALEAQAYELAGEQFNISSPSQVGEILFGKMQIDPKAKKTKRGAWSTTEEILEKYRHTVPIVDVILKVRALKKLLGTYIDALPKLINPVTGKIHTTYNQIVTATGRISSTNPNLQNIPVRTDDGRDIRRAFIPDRGCVMLAADYSQIELRLMADFSGDKEMLHAFASGEDIHRSTAAKIYHLPIEEVTPDMRRKAKTANFGIIYGISAFGLSERLEIPRSEAKMLIDGYLTTYPGVAEYMNNAILSAREQGYVTTIKGRKRYLPDIASRNATVRGYAERNAINAPLQGSAADIIKIAMIAIDREIRARRLRSRMIMQVHDELVFNVYPDELAELQAMVIKEMSGAYSGRVPLEVGAGVGANWLEAH